MAVAERATVAEQRERLIAELHQVGALPGGQSQYAGALVDLGVLPSEASSDFDGRSAHG